MKEKFWKLVALSGAILIIALMFEPFGIKLSDINKIGLVLVMFWAIIRWEITVIEHRLEKLENRR